MNESIFKTKQVALIGGRPIDRQELDSIKARTTALRSATRIKTRRYLVYPIINFMEKVNR